METTEILLSELVAFTCIQQSPFDSSIYHEVIIAVPDPKGNLQIMIAQNATMAEDMKPMVQEIANQLREKVRMVRFGSPEVLQEFIPKGDFKMLTPEEDAIEKTPGRLRKKK